MRYRNKRTGQVQQVPKDSLLHHLMEKSDEFVEVVTDAPSSGKRRGRPSGKKSDSSGDAKGSGSD